MRLWPLHLLLICAVYALGGPLWNATRMAFSGAAEGGVQIDTSGASGREVGGRYVLDLPVDVINRGAGMVLGVSLWVETYGCPSDRTPIAQCRRLTAFEQYLPLRMHPGSAESHSQRMDAVAPAPGEVLRVTRKLQAIEDGAPRHD
ncbi:hypothetical protein ACFOON_06635 [Novosphingobium piscinae]|uniref:Uncharacterized protein n=1 Tax=Novosphingobium piscinae TaxID=1507448 RepID=A0A7X1KPH1_9SPHN|nr:hypothetical protein [Novosphingobium piscinae]MBC2668400.1 hypothetical protein [Novosphingobium piscinae]